MTESKNNTITIDMTNLSPEERQALISLTGKATQPKPKRWKPTFGQTYYYVDWALMIGNKIWDNRDIDQFSYDANNCFKSFEEALFELKRQKAIKELEIFALEHNDSNILNWKDHCSKKWYIAHNHYNYPEIFPDYLFNHRSQGAIYFSSMKIAQAAIESVGEDRIKKYLFNIIE